MEKILTDEKVLELEKEALKKAKDDPWRLKFHLMPISGWLNDPNGLSEIDGVNHIFFQYLPQALKPGPPISWGHYSTDDFVHYKYHLPAIYPEHEYDKDGVFSGSAVNVDGDLRAYYTGNVKKPGDYDYVSEGREQNLVLAEDYNPETGQFGSFSQLMSNEDYPEDLTLHVRDPKVYKRGDDLIMLLGARDKDDKGLILVYESKDGYDWKLKNTIQKDDLGFMWECPDLITIGDKDFLMMSPQGIESLPDNFQNVYQSGYAPLHHFDTNPEIDDFVELDKGFDFYAPQTYVDEDGRRILIGWMGLVDNDYEYPTRENGWVNALTIPRIITEKDNILLQQPLTELEELRMNEESFKLTEDSFTTQVPNSFELILTDAAKTGSIIIRNGCEFKWNDGKLELSFVQDGESVKRAGAGRDTRTAYVKALKSLRIFVDTSSIEIFVNDGEIVFSTRFFPEADENTLVVKSPGSELKLYELGAFEIKRDTGEVLF